MSTSLAEKVAVVTGAAHGIGRAICVDLAREGARVWACDILAADLEETRDAVVDHTAARAHTAVVDVTDPVQVNVFVARIADAEGRIDILVNTAGGVAGQKKRPGGDGTHAGWRPLFALNPDGAVSFSRAGGPLMKRQQSGRIVNIFSGAGQAYRLTR